MTIQHMVFYVLYILVIDGIYTRVFCFVLNHMLSLALIIKTPIECFLYFNPSLF